MRTEKIKTRFNVLSTASLSVVFALSLASRPASAAIFEIEGSCVTIFGYTICVHDEEDKSEGVRLKKRPAMALSEPR